MSTKHDIIGIVREHQRKIADNPWPLTAEAINYILPMQEMDAISLAKDIITTDGDNSRAGTVVVAQALIIAVEALEFVADEGVEIVESGEKEDTIVSLKATEALSRIRSLPTQ